VETALPVFFQGKKKKRNNYFVGARSCDGETKIHVKKKKLGNGYRKLKVSFVGEPYPVVSGIKKEEL